MIEGSSYPQENAQNMAWNFFQLLAQQRVTHFNLFIVFIGASSAAFATQINISMRGNIIACVLSLIESFLCFIFYKIDIRNKFLIKHTEKVIIEIEKSFKTGVPKLFTEEVTSTDEIRTIDRKKYGCFVNSALHSYTNCFMLFSSSLAC